MASSLAWERPPWTLPLRRCQSEAVAKWVEERPESALFDIVPGGGKSLITARLGHALLSASAVSRAVCVVPTDRLRTDLASTLNGMGIRVTDAYGPAWGVLERKYDGVVLTYQQVAANPEAYRHLAVNSALFLDEVHHAATHGLWGRGCDIAFRSALYKCLLTGTGFREDDGALSFVKYDRGEAQALYRYSYLDGLRDRVVRPLKFEVFGSSVRYRTRKGKERFGLTSSDVVEDERREVLRAVVQSEDWLTSVIAAAHEALVNVRRTEDPRAGGLIGAIDMDHARYIAEIVTSVTGTTPVVALSDDKESSDKIGAFRNGIAPWIVAVRQVSEGVDMPRVRIVVHATTTTSRLFVNQFWLRADRYDAALGGEQWATIFMPEDPYLNFYAKTFSEAVLLWGRELRQRRTREKGEKRKPGQFAVLEAEPFSIGTLHAVGVAAAVEESVGDMVVEYGDPAASLHGLPTIATVSSEPTSDDPATLQERREEINRLVSRVSRMTGVKHATLNALLKRRCGARLEQASLEQMTRRVDQLNRWIAKGKVI